MFASVGVVSIGVGSIVCYVDGIVAVRKGPMRRRSGIGIFLSVERRIHGLPARS